MAYRPAPQLAVMRIRFPTTSALYQFTGKKQRRRRKL